MGLARSHYKIACNDFSLFGPLDHPQPYRLGPDDANQTITNLKWKRVLNTKRTVSRAGRCTMSVGHESMYKTGPQLIESVPEIKSNNGFE